MALQRHLVVFARELRLGRGKRRLANRIGTVAAIHFQRVALRALLLRLGRDPRWTTWVAVTPDRGRLSLPQSGVKLRTQGSGIPFNSVQLIPCSRVMLLVDAASGRVQCADTRTERGAAPFPHTSKRWRRGVNAAGGRVYTCCRPVRLITPKPAMSLTFL